MTKDTSPIYHLRQYGDVTKAQMDEYIATGTIKFAQPEQPALPSCYSDDAVAFIEKHLALRNYPANSHNAARAGWDAACDLLTKIAQPEQEGDAKDAEIAMLRNQLTGDNGALTRMDRARNWLTDNDPTTMCNWGVLDTANIRAAIASQKAKP